MSDYALRTRECLAAVFSSAGKHFQVDEGLKPFSNLPDEDPSSEIATLSRWQTDLG